MRLMEVNQMKGEDDSSRSADGLYKTDGEGKTEVREMQVNAVSCEAGQENAKKTSSWKCGENYCEVVKSRQFMLRGLKCVPRKTEVSKLLQDQICILET